MNAFEGERIEAKIHGYVHTSPDFKKPHRDATVRKAIRMYRVKGVE